MPDGCAERDELAAAARLMHDKRLWRAHRVEVRAAVASRHDMHVLIVTARG
jgi:hypothetical protein